MTAALPDDAPASLPGWSRESVMPGRSATIAELLAQGGHSYSFEFFPPKSPEGERRLWTVLRRLEALQP